jgi:carboxymethylenebutenolidase
MKRAATAALFVLVLLGCQREHDGAPAAGKAEHDHGTAGAPDTAATSASPSAKGSVVEIPSSVAGASGYLTLPEGEGKHGAVIVIQEWWGLDDWIRANTDRLAGEGYVALAPDLYRGNVTADPAEAHELSRGVPEDRVMADLKGAFAYLASRPDVDASRIGVVGWCFGGGYALRLAVAEPRLAAAVVNYGHLITDPASIAAIRAPVQGNFGATDRGIPVADVRTFESALKAAGKEADIRVFDGAGHAFMNPANRSGFQDAAAQEAWRRISGFLGEKLKA